MGQERLSELMNQTRFSKVDYLNEIVDPRIYEEELERRNMESRLNNCGLNKRHQCCTFDKYVVTEENKVAFEKVKEYAETFKRGTTGAWLYIAGEYGTGKTHLAASICNHILASRPISRNGIYRTTLYPNCKFDTMIGIADKLRSAMISNSDLMERYGGADLLVIDDLGKEKATNWSMEKLYQIIDKRYTEYKPTVITSNYGLQALAERLTIDGNDDVVQSIVSRLTEMCKGVLIKGEDWRKTHKVESIPNWY